MKPSAALDNLRHRARRLFIIFRMSPERHLNDYRVKCRANWTVCPVYSKDVYGEGQTNWTVCPTLTAFSENRPPTPASLRRPSKNILQRELNLPLRARAGVGRASYRAEGRTGQALHGEE